MSKPIQEDTIVKVSMGMLLTMGGGLIGIVTYLVLLSADTKANTQAIQEVKTDQRLYLENAQSIDRRLSRIEGALDIQPQ